MGCDIHLITQVRQADDSWQTVPGTYPCPSCNGTGIYTSHEGTGNPITKPCYICDRTGVATYYSRNYFVFSVLANVRNFRHDPPVQPIAEPKGLPLDYNGVDGEDVGEHSFSWLTLAELQAYPWEIAAALRGPGWLPTFYTDFMPALAKLGAPEDVRIIFGFDS